jgi:hypothetical protein
LIRNNWIVDAGVYGIFPQFGLNGLMEYNVLRGIEDAAIYVGMATGDVVIEGNIISGNNTAALAVQALYLGNPQGLADYIAQSGKVRPDYPGMPPQDYLSADMRLKVAEYMLSLEQ